MLNVAIHRLRTDVDRDGSLPTIPACKAIRGSSDKQPHRPFHKAILSPINRATFEGPGGTRHPTDEALHKTVQFYRFDTIFSCLILGGQRYARVFHDHALWPQGDPGRAWTRAGRNR